MAAGSRVCAQLHQLRGRIGRGKNVNATRFFTDYGVMVPPGRRFRLVLDTDEARFGGQGRLAPRQTFTPAPVVQDGERVEFVRLYLPARTALVLERMK